MIAFNGRTAPVFGQVGSVFAGSEYEQPLTSIQGDVRQWHRAARTEPVIERETAQFKPLSAVVSQLNPIRCIALDVGDTIVGRNL